MKKITLSKSGFQATANNHKGWKAVVDAYRELGQMIMAQMELDGECTDTLNFMLAPAPTVGSTAADCWGNVISCRPQDLKLKKDYDKFLVSTIEYFEQNTCHFETGRQDLLWQEIKRLQDEVADRYPQFQKVDQVTRDEVEVILWNSGRETKKGSSYTLTQWIVDAWAFMQYRSLSDVLAVRSNIDGGTKAFWVWHSKLKGEEMMLPIYSLINVYKTTAEYLAQNQKAE